MNNIKSRVRISDLVELLRHNYWKGAVEPHSPFVSTRQVASKFQVSTSTANKAINVLVDQGLLYRKEKSGTYYSNAEFRKLKLGVASVPSYTDPARQAGLDVAIRRLRESGADLKFIYFQELRDASIGPKELLGLDGLLISCDIIDPITFNVLRDFKHPITVFFNDYLFPGEKRFVDCPNYNSCALDMDGSCREVCDLIRPNQMVWVVYPEHNNSIYRRNQFLSVLEDINFSKDQIKLIPIKEMNYSGQGVFFRYFFDIAPEFKDKFVFCTSDIISDAALNALSCRNMNAGIDFDWVSCDNLANYGLGNRNLPGLTTIDCMPEACALKAAELLLREVREPSGCQIIARIKTKLINRETVRQR